MLGRAINRYRCGTCGTDQPTQEALERCIQSHFHPCNQGHYHRSEGEVNKCNSHALDSNTEEKDVSELSVRAKRNLFLDAMKTTKKTPTTKPTVPPKPVRRAWSFQDIEYTYHKQRQIVDPTQVTLPEGASLSTYYEDQVVSSTKIDVKEEMATENEEIKESSKDVNHEFIPEKSLPDGALCSKFEKQEEIEESVHETNVTKQKLQSEDISPSGNSVEMQVDVQNVIQEKPTWDKTQEHTYQKQRQIVDPTQMTLPEGASLSTDFEEEDQVASNAKIDAKEELATENEEIKESSKDVNHEFIPEKSLPDGALCSTFEKQEEIEQSVHETNVTKQKLQSEDISPSGNSVERQVDVQSVIQEKPTWDKTQDEGTSDEEGNWEHIPGAEEDEDEKKMMEDFPEDNNYETDKSEIAEGADFSDDSNQQSTVDDTDQAVHLSQNTDISDVSNQLSKHESIEDDVYLKGLQKSTNSTEYERASDIEKSISIDIRKDSITENSVQISWPCKSLKEDEYFVIYYKEEGVKRWKSLEKYLKENHATVSVLEPDKTYQFRVKIKDDEHDTITNYSEISDAITTHPSEVQIWKKRSKKAKHSDSVWILPTVEVMAARDERHMTRKLVLSDCNEGKKLPQKTILVLGATGSGKSTWIDSLANYVLGAEWDGDRFQIVSLEAVEKQREADPTKSLTEWITCYTLVPSKATEGRLSFILNILDTPGIGDTRGISRDEEIIKQIEGLFHKEGEGGIKHIDAICFVFPAPQTRLTASQRYVCETMVALFGKDVAPNIVTITTFFDGHEPNVLGTLKKLRIPYKPWFAFNNGGLFQNTAVQNQSMLREHWKQNVTNFQRLFHTLTCLKPKTLLLTVEVLEKRRSRYHTQDILQTQIKQALDVVWALEQEIAIIVQNKSETVKNKNFKYSIDDVVLEKRNLPADASYKATNCKVCKYTCHLECPKDKKNIKTCISMDQEGYCMSCPKYCHYSKHTKSNVVLERNQRKVEKSIKGKISEYTLSDQREKRTEDVIDELKERVDSYKKRITSLVSILQGIDEEFQEKALCHNPADTADYFDQMIQTEKTERKRGYQNRIQALEKCKGMDIDKDTKAFFDRAKLAEQKLHEAYQKERKEQRESLKNLLVPVQDVPCRTGRHMKEHVVIRYDTKLPEYRFTHEVDEGIVIIKKNPYFVSDEAILASNLNLSGKSGKRSIPASELENIKECIRANAEDLWKKHSNLTIITGDSIKSVNRKNVPKTCIVLYCLSKGYQPINEEPFPKELSCIFGKFETDVREGYFTLGPTKEYGVLDAYNDPICMGSSIGSNWRDVSGSLGLFVDLPQNEMGFITCCHVLFDCIKPDEFHYQKEDTSAPRYVVQPGNTSLCGREYGEKECGIIVKAKFDPCSSQISVDVALVKISKRKPTTGHFVIKDHTQTKELGFTKDELPVFDKGEVRRNVRPTDHDKMLLKSGTSTGLTRSLFRMDGAQVRIFQDGAWLGSKDQRDVIMKGQIEVEGGIINKTFFEPGDSGSAVFVKEPDGQLACIGIAIGKTSYGTTVVTPIGTVLDALGLKDSDVTKFS